MLAEDTKFDEQMIPEEEEKIPYSHTLHVEGGGFSESELLVEKKGGMGGRGRKPEQTAGKNHIKIALERFKEKMRNKTRRAVRR